MAHTDFQSATFDPTVLNANEQDLLLNALNSNKPSAGSRSSTMNKKTVDPSEFASPVEHTPGSVYPSTPFLDYDVDESNFDWDVNGELIGDLPGGSIGDANGDDDEDGLGKRKNSETDEGNAKRRESEGGNKKPGRKPLTSEPTSKRKAQNRAAQRAFRERKEKHLKDLEVKVEDLEKASEAANHENGLLRAQVERLQTELREYRKRLTVGGTATSAAARTSPQTSANPLASKSSWDINNNFQFAFPKFGVLGTDPNNPLSATASIHTSSNAAFNRQNSMSKQSPGSVGQSNGSTGSPSGNGMDELSGLFSPSILATVNSNGDTDYLNFPGQSQKSLNSPAGNSTTSKKSAERTFSDANSNSPASSANNGFTSSCVTTPEYSADSPEARKAGEAAFNSINVESQRRKSSSQEAFCKEFQTACGNKQNPVPTMMSDSDAAPASTATTAMQPTTPALDSHGFDWFANQNGGVFDPVLFGDYRDPQENIMNNDLSGFFNDAFPMNDLGSESHNPLEPALPKKRDLMKEIEETQTGKEPEMVPGENPKQFLTCNMLWDRVQRSARVQSGEADMDDLCSQLKAKAKCSGNGAVIDQKDVDAILGPAPDDSKDFFKMFK